MAKANVKTDLTRAEMEEVIKGGGSVMVGGQHITKIADLPDDADLAQDPEDFEAAALALDAEEDALYEKKRKLKQRYEASQKRAGGEGQKSEPGAGGQKGEPTDDLESLTVPQLKVIADKEQVDLAGATLKADIIGAIQAKRTAGK